jgi:hypothetical protein
MTDLRPQCKYTKGGCWEKHNGEHAKVFFHTDPK